MSPSENSRIWVSVSMVLSFALGIYHLGYQSFWFDEIFSVINAKMEWPKFWHRITSFEANQSLYYFILKFWIIFGEDEATVRFLSLIFSIASIPIIYQIGKNLFDRNVGISAAFLLGLNGFFIYFAQEARGYSMLLFFTLCSSYFAIRCVKSSSRRAWVGFVVTSIVSAYAHFFAIWIMIVQAISLILLPRKLIDWKAMAIASIIIVIGVSPLLIFIINSDGGQIAWIKKPSYSSYAKLIHGFSGWSFHQTGYFYKYLYHFNYIIPALFLIYTFYKKRFSFDSWRYGLILLWHFLPLFLVYFASEFKPMFQKRYMIIVLPGFVLLAAVAMTRFPWKWVSFFAVSVLSILSIVNTVNSYNYSSIKKEDWRGLGKYIQSSSKTDDGILIFPSPSRLPFKYYLEKANSSSKVYHFSEKRDRSKILSEGHQRLWTIVRYNLKNADLMAIQNKLKKDYIKKHMESFDDRLYAILYEKKDN